MLSRTGMSERSGEIAESVRWMPGARRARPPRPRRTSLLPLPPAPPRRSRRPPSRGARRSRWCSPRDPPSESNARPAAASTSPSQSARTALRTRSTGRRTSRSPASSGAGTRTYGEPERPRIRPLPPRGVRPGVGAGIQRVNLSQALPAGGGYGQCQRDHRDAHPWRNHFSSSGSCAISSSATTAPRISPSSSSWAMSMP